MLTVFAFFGRRGFCFTGIRQFFHAMKNYFCYIYCACMLLTASSLQANHPGKVYAYIFDSAAYTPIVSNTVLTSNTTICHGTSPGMIMGSNPSDGTPGAVYTYQWQSSTTSGTEDFSNIISGDGQHYTPGNLTVTTWFRRIVTSATETSTSDPLQITVIPAIVQLVINDPDPVCSPQSIDLTDPAVVAGSTAGLSFLFFNDAAGTDPLLHPEAINSATALDRNYYIKAANTCGDEVIQPVRVVINTPPDISVTGPVSPVCRGTELTLTATAPGSTVQWQGLGSGHTVQIAPQTSSTYTAVATSSQGCTATATATVNVIDFAMQLTANPSVVLSGNPVTLTSSANSLYAVDAWLPENVFANQVATAQTIQATAAAATFSVVGVSEDGCRDTASVMLTVNANENDVFIPNAFTPNNDGKNDVFKVYGSAIREIDMKIYNQWGNFVFETKDNQLGWNGTQNGKHQPVGVYMYIIKVKLQNEDSFIRKGSVTLIR